MGIARLIAAGALVGVAACGGGGGSGSTPTEAITGASPPSGTTFVAYPGYAFVASKGGVPPFSWTESGPMPQGLTLSTSGQLTGTPTIAGDFPIVVAVSDSSAPPLTAQVKVTLHIVDDPQIVIATSPLPPTGTVAAAYPPFPFSPNPFPFSATGGTSPLVWTETGALPGGLSLSSDGMLSGTPTTAGQFPITVKVTDKLNQSAQLPVIVRVSLSRSGSFTLLSTGMAVPRFNHTATLLNTGKVLVTGGNSGAAPLASAELYDPAKGTFAPTGNMTEPRSGHTATLLDDPGSPNYGKVLLLGSVDTSAELYDPATGVFTATGSMSHARTSPTATWLQTGKVLVVGGNTVSSDLTAELYDPATQTFSTTGNTTVPRSGHKATLLLDGRVLIVGGQSSCAAAELYDPAAGTFTSTGSTTVDVCGDLAVVRLQDGKVLVLAGDGSSELYDPNTGTFAPVGGYPVTEILGVGERAASLRSDGSVLVAGGATTRYYLPCDLTPETLSDAALFAPESDGFTFTGDLNMSRSGHTATLLPDGTVLIVGGNQWSPVPCDLTHSVLASAELFR